MSNMQIDAAASNHYKINSSELSEPDLGGVEIANGWPGEESLPSDISDAEAPPELGPAAREAYERIVADPENQSISGTLSDMAELVDVDSLFVTMKDPKGNVYSMSYSGLTSEELARAAEDISDTGDLYRNLYQELVEKTAGVAPKISITVNAPIAKLGGGKPVVSFDPNATNADGEASATDVLRSVEAGFGWGIWGSTAQAKLGLKDFGETKFSVSASAPTTGTAAAHVAYVLIAYGMLETTQALSQGTFNSLPQAAQDVLSDAMAELGIDPTDKLSDQQKAVFIPIIAGVLAQSGVETRIGAANSLVADFIPDFENSFTNGGEIVSLTEFAGFEYKDINPNQYVVAAENDIFTDDPRTDRDVPLPDVSELLGSGATDFEKSLGSFLFSYYTEQGFDLNEVRLLVQRDMSVGSAGYDALLTEYVEETMPRSITPAGFQGIGIPVASSYAMSALAQSLVLEHQKDPEVAVKMALGIWKDGFINNGGHGGALGHLQFIMENKYGVDPSQVFNSRVTAEFDQEIVPGVVLPRADPKHFDGELGDFYSTQMHLNDAQSISMLVAYENTPLPLRDLNYPQVSDSFKKSVSKFGTVESVEDITLLDKTPAKYVVMSTGDIYVLVEGPDVGEENFSQFSEYVFPTSATTPSQARMMQVISEMGSLRLVSLNSPQDLENYEVSVPNLDSESVALPTFGYSPTSGLGSAVVGEAEYIGSEETADLGRIGKKVDYIQESGEIISYVKVEKTVILLDGTESAIVTYYKTGPGHEGVVAESYMRIGDDVEYFDRTQMAPNPHRSFLVSDPETDTKALVQIDDISDPSNPSRSLGERFADGSLRRIELRDGAIAIFGESSSEEVGAETSSVLVITASGEIRLLDVTDIPTETVIDMLEREGLEYKILGNERKINFIVPDGDGDLSSEARDDRALNEVLVSATDLTGLLSKGEMEEVASDTLGGPGSLTGAALRYAETYDELLSADVPDELASHFAYDLYQLSALGSDVDGYSNTVYRDASFDSLGEYSSNIPAEAFNAVFDTAYNELAYLMIGAMNGDPMARQALETLGLEFDKLPNTDRYIVRNDHAERGAVAQISLLASATAQDANVYEEVAELLEIGGSVSDIRRAVYLGLGLAEAVDAELTAYQTRLQAARDEVANILSAGTQLGGNENAAIFLGVADTILGALQAGTSATLAEGLSGFFSSSKYSIGAFVEKLAIGDADAWAEFTSDLGTVISTFSDDNRANLVNHAYGLSLLGSSLVLLSSFDRQGDTPALAVSGQAVSIAADSLLAAAGETPTGFGEGVAPGLVALSGLGAVGASFAGQTSTPIDDIGALLAEDLTKTISQFNAGRLEAAIGDTIGLITGALGTAIEGNVGRIIDAAGKVAQSGLTTAAQATPMSVANAVLTAINVGADLAEIEVPTEVQLGALATSAALNATNPLGWGALGVQIISQLANMGSWTEVRTIAQGIDADGDAANDDLAQANTEFFQTFGGNVLTTGGNIQYDVNSPNVDLLNDTTFEVKQSPHIGLRVDHDSDGGTVARIWKDGGYVYGDIRTASDGGSRINYYGDSGSAKYPRAEDAGFFVSEAGDIKLPVVISKSDGVATFRLADDYRDHLSDNFSVTVSGSYNRINPDIESSSTEFMQRVNLTEEQYENLRAELGLNPGEVKIVLDLDAEDSLIRDQSKSTLQWVMGEVQVMFDSERASPDLYFYDDINGDGNLDRVRYGIEADADGMDDGDEIFTVELMSGKFNQSLDLPALHTSSLEEAKEAGEMLPYLTRWAASRPDLYQYGLDAVSIWNVAEEKGALQDLIELRSLDFDLAQDIAAMESVIDVDGNIREDYFENLINSQSLRTNADSNVRRDELLERLNLFDVRAYMAANHDLPQDFTDEQAAHHYMTYGNQEGRAIDADGTTLKVGRQPMIDNQPSYGQDLYAGEVMVPGSQLISENGQYVAEFQRDGDLVIYEVSENGTRNEIWEVEQGNQLGSQKLEMGTDGNFRILNKYNEISFETNIVGGEGDGAHDQFVLRMQDDGQLAAIDLTLPDFPLWLSGGPSLGSNSGYTLENANMNATNEEVEAARDVYFRSGDSSSEWIDDDTSAHLKLESLAPVVSDDGRVGVTLSESEVLFSDNQLDAGAVMLGGEFLLSENGNFRMELQEDGDLRLISSIGGSEQVVWELGYNNDTPPTSDVALVMQADGNLVIYGNNENGEELAYFATNTNAVTSGGENAPHGAEHGLFALILRNDGQLAVWDMVEGDALWLVGPGQDSLQGTFVRRAGDESTWSEAEVEAAYENYFPTATSPDLAVEPNVTDPQDDMSAYDAAYENMSDAEKQVADAIMTTDEGALTYLASNVALARTFIDSGDEDPIAWAREEFSNVGYQQEFHMDFNPLSYISAPGNDDLILAYHDNRLGAIMHFVTVGLEEYDSGIRHQVQLDDGETPNDTAQDYMDFMTSPVDDIYNYPIGPEGAYAHLEKLP